MAKQEFLQLAHKLNMAKVSVAGRFVSEKLDGQRFMWDGGVSRGLLAKDVPYANTVKDGRYVEDQPATGLWSRYGKAIQAPHWWLDRLPPFPVEGELWTGHGEFQRVSSIVRSSVNVHPDWNEVKAVIFDAPPAVTLFRPRKIRLPIAEFEIGPDAFKWWETRFDHDGRRTHADTPFQQRYRYLQLFLEQNDTVRLLQQTQLPLFLVDAEAELNAFTDRVLELGGEGTMLKAPNDLWLPQRVHSLLKYKPFYDAEGVVAGWTWGRKTDKGSKLLGKMGALILESGLKLSGFTDAEREMIITGPVDVEAVAGEVVDPTLARSKHFPVGATVTFKYREMSDDGVPKEARYWRKNT